MRRFLALFLAFVTFVGPALAQVAPPQAPQLGPLYPGANQLTATGSTQATAALLTYKVSVFTTVPAGSGASLPANAYAVTELIVMNRGVNPLLVYPPPSGQIDTNGFNVPVSIASGASATFYAFNQPTTASYQWYENLAPTNVNSFTNINLSSLTFASGQPSGTAIASITPVLTNGSFSGSLSLSGANAGSFAINGSTLVTSGVVGTGTYNITITAAQNGLSNSPFSKPFTLTASTAPAFNALTLSNNTFVGGSASGTVVGNITATLSSGSFTGSLSLSGPNASSFQIVGNSLETNGVVGIGTFSVNITATQPGVSNSPYAGTSPYVITGTNNTGCTNQANFSQPCNSGLIILLF